MQRPRRKSGQQRSSIQWKTVRIDHPADPMRAGCKDGRRIKPDPITDAHAFGGVLGQKLHRVGTDLHNLAAQHAA